MSPFVLISSLPTIQTLKSEYLQLDDEDINTIERRTTKTVESLLLLLISLQMHHHCPKLYQKVYFIFSSVFFHYHTKISLFSRMLPLFSPILHK